MRTQRWMLALIGLLAVGLLAAGCGGDDDETTSSESSTPTEMTNETTEATADGASAEDVYNACVDAVEGAGVEDQVMPQCEQARDAFEECANQAGNAGNDQAAELALQICQQAADQAVKSLEAAGG